MAAEMLRLVPQTAEAVRRKPCGILAARGRVHTQALLAGTTAAEGEPLDPGFLAGVGRKR